MASNEIENLDPMATVEEVKGIAASRALNRRNFLAAFGMTGVAAGAGLMSGCNATTTSVPVTKSSPAETNLLNFALNLEWLEATYFSYLTTGADIALPPGATVSVSLTGSGAVSGAPALLALTGTNAQQTTDLLNEIYFDAFNHVAFLQSLLGSSAAARPAINLAAFGAITPTNAIGVARMLKDLLSSAYAGAIPLLSSSNCTYASQILGVESVHAGALRLISIQSPTTFIAVDNQDVTPADPGTPALSAAGPGSIGAFFATYASWAAGTTAGVAYSRNTSQVLAVLYGGLRAPAASGTSKGGFFPSGMNGAINTI